MKRIWSTNQENKETKEVNLKLFHIKANIQISQKKFKKRFSYDYFNDSSFSATIPWSSWKYKLEKSDSLLFSVFLLNPFLWDIFWFLLQAGVERLLPNYSRRLSFSLDPKNLLLVEGFWKVCMVVCLIDMMDQIFA